METNDSGSSKGKHPEAAVGFRTQANMVVQPPKMEDLQQSYATIITHDANPKGWYGMMSMSIAKLPRAMAVKLSLSLSRLLTTTPPSQCSWYHYRNHGRYSLLRLLPEPIQGRQAG